MLFPPRASPLPTKCDCSRGGGNLGLRAGALTGFYEPPQLLFRLCKLRESPFGAMKFSRMDATPAATVFGRIAQVQHFVKQNEFHDHNGRFFGIEQPAQYNHMMRRVVMAERGA